MSDTPQISLLPARTLDLGRREYAEIWELQRALVRARQDDEIPDTLLLVEHPDVITLGRGSHRENLLQTSGIPLFEIERGGDVTYHGPGQLVGYPIFLLREGERDLHEYLRNIEESLIQAVGVLGVAAGRREGWTGVWAGDRKLASIGVAVKRWVTMHGFALNVSTDLTRFGAINPCGLQAGVMSSVSSVLGRPVELGAVSLQVRRAMQAVFRRSLQ